MLSTTTAALEKFDNTHEFERMAADILNATGNSNVLPIAPRGGSDGGKDISYNNPSMEKSLAFVSLEKNPVTKFKKDAKKHAAGDYQEYTYFTNQYLTASEKLKLQKLCNEDLAATLIIRDVETIRSLLDASLQDIRKRYLHIDETRAMEYQLKPVDVTAYNVHGEINKAVSTYNDTKQKFESNSSMSGVIPVSFAALGVRSTSEVLTELDEHVSELTEMGNRIFHLVSFNVHLIANEYDENVQVEIYCPDPYEFDFEHQHLELPEKPSTSLQRNFMSGAYLPLARNLSSVSHKDPNEFYALLTDHNKTVKSNIAVLNPNQPKYVFDEKVFLIGLTKFEPVKLGVKIFSKNIKNPITKTIEIDNSNPDKTNKISYTEPS